MADFAAQVCSDTERWQSGRMHQTRNLAYVHSVPWVQIPPFPPKIRANAHKARISPREDAGFLLNSACYFFLMA